MTSRVSLARSALRIAMQLRRNLSISRDDPVNAFDLAAQSGLSVHFLDAPSLEGMLVRDPGARIFLPSTRHRPKARILFSCAHELGHQQFGHGTKADEYVEHGNARRGFVPEEYLADTFAGHVLMPRAAVIDAFERRGWKAESPTPLQLFIVAGELGVGYGTLADHMTMVMELLPEATRDRLQKVSPKSIKSSLVGEDWPGTLIVADAVWRRVPIDAEVNNRLILPRFSGDGCPLLTKLRDDSDRSLYSAARSGTATLDIGGGSRVLRVARQHYVGPLKNRYLDDPDEH